MSYTGSNRSPSGGEAIAVDDIGGQRFQRIKLGLGAEGVAVDAPGDEANGQDVDVTRSALPTGAATGAKQDTQQTRLNLLATETKLEAVRVLLAGTLVVDSELPSPLAPADGMANGLVPHVGARDQLLGPGGVWNRERDAALAVDGDPGTGLGAALQMAYNGTTYDQARANSEQILLAANVARTSNWSGSVQINPGWKGVAMVVDVKIAGATGFLRPRLRGSLPGMTQSTPIKAEVTTAITGTGTYVYEYYPGIAEREVLTAGYVRQTFNVALLRRINPYVQHSGSDPWDYDVYLMWIA